MQDGEFSPTEVIWGINITTPTPNITTSTSDSDKLVWLRLVYLWINESIWALHFLNG